MKALLYAYNKDLQPLDISFAKRRMNKFNGVKKNFHLHLKECEFRYGKSDKEIYNELIQIIKKHRF